MGDPVTGPEAAGADARGPGGARVAGVVLSVDPASGEPPFRQLMSQIVEATRRGVLTPGTRLPAVRTLAENVGISTATAAKVYRELEDGGVLEGRGRRCRGRGRRGRRPHRLRPPRVTPPVRSRTGAPPVLAPYGPNVDALEVGAGAIVGT